MAFDQTSPGTDTISQINVTPLVDVMLVLLIIFMVAAPMLQTGVPVTLPKADAQAIPDDQTDKLRAIAVARPDRQLYVRADQTVPYGQVMRVMGAVHDAGLVRVGLVTEPPPPDRRR